MHLRGCGERGRQRERGGERVKKEAVERRMRERTRERGRRERERDRERKRYASFDVAAWNLPFAFSLSLVLSLSSVLAPWSFFFPLSLSLSALLPRGPPWTSPRRSISPFPLSRLLPSPARARKERRERLRYSSLASCARACLRTRRFPISIPLCLFTRRVPFVFSTLSPSCLDCTAPIDLIARVFTL